MLNTACGAFESVDTFVTNNISNSIKTFITEGWWVIGLDHKANLDIQEVISKLKRTKNVYLYLALRKRNKKVN